MRSALCSLHLASMLLRIIDGYEVSDHGGAGASPSLVATTYDPVLGSVFVRFAFADEVAPGDIDRWAVDDPPGASLCILVRDDRDVDLGTALLRRASVTRPTEVRSWSDFFAGMLRLGRITDHYDIVAEEYRETEGPGFRYVDQSAVISGHRERLLDWTLKGNVTTGVTYVVAEYGEGKSSFCLNYVFGAMKRVRDGGPVPLLFNLNEFEAGNLTAFIEKRLRDDFQLELSFLGLRQLCQLGVFVPVLDAFDQMHNGEGGPARIERDHGHLMELRSSVSPLFVTCRMNFFEQHVRGLRDNDGFGVVTLRGFDQTDVRTALQDDSQGLSDLLEDPANREVLATTHLKPLMLHVILRHAALFSDLVQQRKEAAETGGELQPVAEYDVFSLLYESWVEHAARSGLLGRKLASSLMRAITSRVQLEGMNQPVALSQLKRTVFRELVATPEATRSLVDDLLLLPLLNRVMLRRDEPTIAFRFNAYLEFLTARFVIDELTPTRTARRELVKQNPLTWETRQMIAPNLRVKVHGERMQEIAANSRHATSFLDVKFEASNVVTLMLDCIQHQRVAPAERTAWREHLTGVPLQGTQLRRLDARGADLSEIKLSGADLRDADFSFAILRAADFRETRLDGSTFTEAGAVLTTMFLSQSEDDPERWRLAGGTENGMVVFWDSANPYPKRTPLHKGEIKALGAAGGDAPVLSVALDGWCGESDPSDPQAPLCFPLGAGGLRALTSTPEGDVVVGGDWRTLVVLDRGMQEHHRLELPEARRALVTALAFDPTSDRLYAGDSDGDVYEFLDWRTPAVGRLWQTSLGGEVRSLAVMRDRAVLAVVDRVGVLTMRATATAAEPLGDGRPAVSAGYALASDVIVWHDGVTVWRQTREQGGQPSPVGSLPSDMGNAILSCSADASFVAAGGNRIRIWHDGFTGIELVRDEPMRMDCTGMVLSGCEGLTAEQQEFINDRGGVL